MAISKETVLKGDLKHAMRELAKKCANSKTMTRLSRTPEFKEFFNTLTKFAPASMGPLLDIGVKDCVASAKRLAEEAEAAEKAKPPQDEDRPAKRVKLAETAEKDPQPEQESNNRITLKVCLIQGI